MKQGIKIADFESYVAQYPDRVQLILKELRRVIRKAAPEAGEKISYGMPTFTLHGNLVYFAAYQHHIGFYPGAQGIASFIDEISIYKSGKGSVQFPIDRPMPFNLITRIVKFRVQQNLEKTALKKYKR